MLLGLPSYVKLSGSPLFETQFPHLQNRSNNVCTRILFLCFLFCKQHRCGIRKLLLAVEDYTTGSYFRFPTFIYFSVARTLAILSLLLQSACCQCGQERVREYTDVRGWEGYADSDKMPFSEYRDLQKCSGLSLGIKQSISMSTVLLFTMICSIKQDFHNPFLVFYKSSSSGFFH